MIFFVLINFSGTVVYALGLHMRSFTVLVVGRAIFGMGGESLNVANSNLVLYIEKAAISLRYNYDPLVPRQGASIRPWVLADTL